MAKDAAALPGLLFDMDGLLFDTEAIGEEAFIEVVAPLGMGEAEAKEAYLHFVGGNAEETRARIKRRFPQVDPMEAQAAWVKAYEARIADGVPLKPTVADTLDALALRGHAMAVVTSSWRNHAEHNLSVTGILPLFKGIIPGDEVARTKPDPEPYLQGAALIGREPMDCVAFEDSDPGITAAARAGCRCVQIPDMRPAGQPFPEIGQLQAKPLAEAAHLTRLLCPTNTPEIGLRVCARSLGIVMPPPRPLCSWNGLRLDDPLRFSRGERAGPERPPSPKD